MADEVILICCCVNSFARKGFMKRKKNSFPVIVFLTFFIGTSSTSASELLCEYLYPIQKTFVQQHVNYAEDVLDFSLREKLPGKPSASVKKRAEIEKRTIDQYVKRFDSSKLYLMQSDHEALRKILKGVFQKVGDKNCSPLVQAQKLFNKRVKERADFAKAFLSDKKFKFDKETSIVLDPEKRPVARTKKDLDAFQKKYIQFQLSNYLATDMDLEEAKQYVIRNYERVVNRISELSTEDIYSGYLDSFAHSLDPHSSFFPKDVLEDFEISMRLSLEGIGATLTSEDGFTVIEQLIPGGAAFRSGELEAKDKIIGVAQGVKGKMETVIEMELRDVVRKIRGKKGSQVRLNILRKGKEGAKRFEVLLVRDQIKLEDEAASIHYIERDVNGIKKTFGVIDLPGFYSDSRKNGRSAASDVKKLIKEARQKNVAGIVLDLSSNPGGSLDDAVKLAGLFIAKGAVVKQSSKHSDSDNNNVLADVDSDVDYTGPMVILTSRLSASASEIVAGTLRDYGRAVVVGGDHTFGKGTVQQVIPLPQKLGAIKVTVGMFFVPGGYSTQHLGVNSDIVFPSALNTDEIGEKTLDYSLPVQKIGPFLSSSAFVSEGPNQWEKLSPEVIEKLRKESLARINKNVEFQKIVSEAKDEKKKEVKQLKLADVMKKAEDAEKKKAARYKKSKEEKEKEFLERIELVEAVNVLSDLVSHRETGLTIGARGKEAKSQGISN
jgi:carboxyl-terminal processing protease